MLVRYLPGLGISEIRDLFFRGPIWIRLRNSGSFGVGQVPGTSHVATRPRKHTCDRCRGLLQPAPPPVCSWLFKPSLMWYVYQVQRYFVIVSPVFPPYLFFCRLVVNFFSPGLYSSKECCLLLLAVFLVFFFRSFSRFFLCQTKCTHQGSMVIALYQRSSLLPKITVVFMHNIVLKQGRDDSTLSSLRAYK